MNIKKAANPRFVPALFLFLLFFRVVAQEESLSSHGHLGNKIHYFESMLSVDSSNMKHRYELSRAYYNAKVYAEAKRQMDILLIKDENNPHYQFLNAKITYRLKQYQESLESYAKVRERLSGGDPIDQMEVDYYEGMLHIKLKKYPEAIGLLDNAIRSAPNHSRSHLNRGIALGNMGNVTEACKSFNRAYDLGDQAALSFIRKYCKLSYQRILSERGQKN